MASPAERPGALKSSFGEVNLPSVIFCLTGSTTLHDIPPIAQEYARYMTITCLNLEATTTSPDSSNANPILHMTVEANSLSYRYAALVFLNRLRRGRREHTFQFDASSTARVEEGGFALQCRHPKKAPGIASNHAAKWKTQGHGKSPRLWCTHEKADGTPYAAIE